jgi:hypothetical protein
VNIHALPSCRNVLNEQSIGGFLANAQLFWELFGLSPWEAYGLPIAAQPEWELVEEEPNPGLVGTNRCVDDSHPSACTTLPSTAESGMNKNNAHERTIKSRSAATPMHDPAAYVSADLAKMVGILLAFTCLMAGCAEGSATRQPRPRIGAPPAAVCPGVDVAALRALYVSPQGSDEGMCGAYGSGGPCKTIAFALTVADTFGYQAIVLQHGLYQTTETIDLKGGVSLYGSCLFDGEPDRKYRTTIQASPAPGTPAISADAVNVTVSGLVVIAKDEAANGTASIAMTAGNASVTLGRTVFVAGKGGPGASRPPVQSPAAVRSSTDVCYTPGGAASDSLWGHVDLGSFNWVSGIGGAGAGGQETGPGGVGGQQGGASIGLLLVNSTTVTTAANEFNRIIAGGGGIGGAGQAGPSFGLGGGANSGGAGGNGGPSIGIASIRSGSVPSSGFYSYANAPGAPGGGGAAGVDAGQCQGDPGSPGVPGGSAAAYQFPIPTTLTPGESLAGNQSLYSPNIQFQLILGGNSNLCLVSAGKTVWCSQTEGQGIYQAIMQSDGNFCMYETAGQFLPICSGSAGHPGARLTVQDSGHAQVIDTNGAVLWSVP